MGNPVKTPGEDEPGWKMEDGEQKLDGAQAARFRAVAARANYLAADRVGIQHAVKECCRDMVAPEMRHW